MLYLPSLAFPSSGPHPSPSRNPRVSLAFPSLLLWIVTRHKKVLFPSKCLLNVSLFFSTASTLVQAPLSPYCILDVNILSYMRYALEFHMAKLNYF